MFYDSQAYLEIAARPLGTDRPWDYKPLVVPVIDGAAGGDPRAIQIVQVIVALVAWSLFALALAAALRRIWVRALAVIVACAFLLAAPRIGWTAAVLSESIDDSLLALVIAGALALVALRESKREVARARDIRDRDRRGRPPRGSSRAIPTRSPRSSRSRSPRSRGRPRKTWRVRRHVALAAVAVIGAGVALWSTRVAPEPLPFQRGWWAPALTARATYPVADNILGTRAARRSGVARRARRAGRRDLARLKDADVLVGTVPDRVPAQDWCSRTARRRTCAGSCAIRSIAPPSSPRTG